VIRFSLLCETDGPVELTADDLRTISVTDSDVIELLFACPHCGAEIRGRARLPELYVAVFGLAASPWIPMHGRETPVARAARPRPARAIAERSPEDVERIDRYCEYFRRELALVRDADEALREMEAG
jgi:hypothetical protein